MSKPVCSLRSTVFGMGVLAMCWQAATAAPAKKAAPLRLEEAMYLALENNLSMKLRQLDPLKARLEETAADAVFDPTLQTEVRRSGGRTQGETGGAVSLRQTTQTGASIQLSLDLSQPDGGGRTGGMLLNPSVGVTVPLKEGAGKAVNLVRMHQARISTAASLEEVRATAISLAGQVYQAYLRCLLAEKKISIFQESLTVAERQLEQTRFLIRVGKLAGVERAAAEAEVANRREALVSAEGDLKRTRLQLARLINQTETTNWGEALNLAKDLPGTTTRPGELKARLKQALTSRPELVQSKLDLKRRSLEVVRTQNGLLPRMDVFASLSRQERVSGIGETVNALLPLGGGYSAGVRWEWQLDQRTDKASHVRAMLNIEEGKLAIKNLEQTIEEDVRQAHLDLTLARDQLAATQATLKQQEVKAAAEENKFKTGTSTALQVAQTQRDLLASQIAETEALLRIHQAMGVMLEQDGSLLKTYGLNVRLETSAR